MTKQRLLLVVSIAFGLCGGTGTVSRAGTVVPGLDDAAALRIFTTINQTVTDTRGKLPGGLTLTVRLTPSATDVYNSFTGPVNLLDIGGTQSGSALVLLDGQYWFVSKSNGGAAAPTGIADCEGVDGAVGVAIGAAVPDQQADVYASFDGMNARLTVGLDGKAVVHELAHVPDWNWKGNGTLTFAGNDAALNGKVYGSRGGLSDFDSSRFYTNLAMPFTGKVGLGQYFNATAAAQAVVPTR